MTEATGAEAQRGEGAQGAAGAPAAAPAPICKGECVGYFYVVDDVKPGTTPDGLDSDDAEEALRNAALRQHPFEPDDGHACNAGCVCQPLEVKEGQYGAPSFTTPWKEPNVEAKIRLVNDTTERGRYRTFK